MSLEMPNGATVYREAYFRGQRPEPDVWVDLWADEYMRIPRDTGAAEPGQYRTARTPYAREPMRCLSPAHPCKRVVTMVASQLMKTQIALNWIGGLIHMAPSNILTLLPSLGLAKRVSSRISKTIKATPVLRERVAANRSRDARNTMDTKEFEGGSLYITTAGSAANLAELSARYIYGDEVDRWSVDVGEEGDPVELAETRGSTFGRNAKFYFSSSPTIRGASRIADLFEVSDQRYYYVPCPTCGHMQVLEWERLHYSADFQVVHYQCAGPGCDVLIEEFHKGEMLSQGEWRAHAQGDGETVGFNLNALYSPPGWTGWASLAKQFEKAKKAQAKGDLEPMQVFYNTRLAKVWDSAQEQTKADVLRERARLESYCLGSMPEGVLMLTASVDTQANRLELMVMGWGAPLRKLLQELWEDWVDESDADERTDFYGQQALVARTVEASGECFVRLRPRGLDEGLAVPLQIQILAPEFVPHDKFETTKAGNVIRAGIEFTPGGKRVAYWMYLSHPRDASSLNAGYNQLVRVPAAQVLHIFEPVEPGQLRGVPRLSPVLKRLRSLDNYDDAVLFRQEVANLFAGFITRPPPDSGPVPRDPITGQPLSLDRDGFTPMVALEPGTMQELGPGEEVEFSKPPDAGNNYPDFMRQQLMAAAAGTGTPYEILTGDMREVNDRALRVVLNEFRRRLEQLQFGVYVHQLCRPVRAAWMDMAVLSGSLVLDDYTQRRREYLRTRWIPQGWAYIQPVQDVQARRMEVQAGFASRSEMVLRTGYDAETVDAENAADLARAAELGLNYNTLDAVVTNDDKEQP